MYTNNPESNVGFSYVNAALVIRTWAFDLSKRVNSHLLVGAMVTSFSLNLLGHVLDLEDLQHSGFIDGIYLLVATDKKLESGMIGKVGTYAALLAHPVYLSAIKEAKMYKIEEVYPLTAANWIPRTSSNIKQSTSLIKIAEVK